MVGVDLFSQLSEKLTIKAQVTLQVYFFYIKKT